ncbi:FtsX-like permease family protein [Chitinophaga varians]|uniref:FtsX-like permease family protein n=1 Tax=Chitinophaga varians TaxID=2202339 RepID=A0A847S408_9BACT|nr:ABC transporter permease [Chitinophaga varians]NLR66251.1 FtsX-like permease family protein [Chitinophaga varians]
MLINYFKTAFRSLRRNRVYTAVNILGLSAGIAICLVIFVIIRFETGFDRFHTKQDRVYRVMTKMGKNNGNETIAGSVAVPLPGVLTNEIPSIAAASPFVQVPDMEVKLPQENSLLHKTFKEKKGVFAVVPAFFQMVDFTWLAGNPSVLADRQALVLTRETATRYFGDWKKALGQTIQLGIDMRLQVSGIVERPVNTEFQFDLLIPFAATPYATNDNWAGLSSVYQCYVLLAPKADVAGVDRQLAQLAKKYLPADMKNIFFLQPLQDVHLSQMPENIAAHGITPDRVRAMWCIAGFILLIACINFINLSTAQVVQRSREAGIRKVLGGNPGQLRLQFFVETFILVLFSCVLGFSLSAVMVQPLGMILGIPLPRTELFQLTTGVFLLVVLLAVTLLSGIYPAIVLARTNPVSTLKNRLLQERSNGFSLRKWLVIFQFMVAQALIIGTLIIVKQMTFFRTASMGFEKDYIVDLPMPGGPLGAKRDLFHERLLRLPEVAAVSFNTAPPASDDNWWTDFKFDNNPKSATLNAIHKAIDAAYLPLFRIPLAAGRNVTATDSVREFLLNETLVKKLGYHQPEEVLNKPIEMWGFMKGMVVGVVKDFHATSLKEAVAPQLLFNFKEPCFNATVRLTGTDLSAAMRSVEKTWDEVYPDTPFEYQFLDDKIAGFYTHEMQLSSLYRLFAGIAIFLSCLGLYGLASYMAVQRVKEVGVRKVLGATVANIVILFSREFVVMVAVAFVLAVPLAWYFLHQWLRTYAYSVSLHWWIFAAGGIAALIIAMATVSFHALRAAMANPVKSLRGE